MPDATCVSEQAPVMIDEDYCPCAVWMPLISRENHDWLLGFEKRGLVGAIELLNYAYNAEGCVPEAGEIGWLDIPQFVTLHRWEQPAAVHQFVQLIDSEIRARQRGFAATVALESIETLAGETLDRMGTRRHIERSVRLAELE